MVGVIALWGGRRGGRQVGAFRVVYRQGPGRSFAWGRIGTFGSEQIDMVGGLGMVGEQVCACRAFGSSLDVFGLDLAV